MGRFRFGIGVLGCSLALSASAYGAGVPVKPGCKFVAPETQIATGLAAEFEQKFEKNWVSAIGRPAGAPASVRGYVEKGPYFKEIIATLKVGNTISLYSINGYLAPIISLANSCLQSPDASIDYRLILEESAALLNMMAEIGLKPHQISKYREFAQSKLSTFPGNKEVQMHAAEFLALSGRVLAGVASLPPALRGTESVRLLATFPKIIGYDHLFRWTMEGSAKSFPSQASIGLACPSDDEFNATLGDHLVWKLAHQKSCRAMTDRLLLTAEAALGLLRAEQLIPGLISPQVKSVARDIAIAVGITLRLKNAPGISLKLFGRSLPQYPFTGRMQSITVQSRSTGGSIATSVYDPTGFDRYHEQKHAGYVGLELPKAGSTSPSTQNGWDISHGRRIMSALKSYVDFQSALGLEAPLLTGGDLTRFANRVIYAVMEEGTCSAPKFANYFNARGWYKYDDKSKTGYGPNGLGLSVLSKGFFQLSPYSSGLRLVSAGLVSQFEGTTAESKQYRLEYLHSGYTTQDMATRRDIASDTRYAEALNRAGFYSSLFGFNRGVDTVVRCQSIIR